MLATRALQADRQGRAADFAAAYAASEFKAAADREIEVQLAQASDLGAPTRPPCCWRGPGAQLVSLGDRGRRRRHRPQLPPSLPCADEATRADLAVRRDTVTPFWWGLKTLLKVGRGCGQRSRAARALMRRPAPIPTCCTCTCARPLVRACPPKAPGRALHGLRQRRVASNHPPRLRPSRLVLLQFRALKNYRSPDYLGPRIGDKLIFS